MGATYEQLVKARDNGTLDNWLKSGQIDQAKYDNALLRIKNEAPAPTDSIGRLQKEADESETENIDAATMKKRARMEYDAKYKAGDLPWSRGNGYVPGIGSVVTEEGPEWDAVKQAVPGSIKDKIFGWAEDKLGAIGAAIAGPDVTSRGVIWKEPTSEEAIKEMNLGSDSALGQDHAQYKEWADKKWAEAYDLAQSQGRTLYRGSAINEKSPAYLRDLKGASELIEPMEAFFTPFAKATTLSGGDTSNMEVPEDWVAVPKPNKDELRQNIERSDRAQEAQPVAEFAGNMLGAAGPGAMRQITRGAEKFLKVDQARGALSAFGRNALAAGVSTFPAEALIINGEETAREQAGMKPRYDSVSAEAARRSGAAAMFAGLLGAPRGSSNRIRSELDVGSKASALSVLEEAEGSTSMLDGVTPPPGFEDMARSNPVGGAAAGFREQAADEGARSLMSRAGNADESVIQPNLNRLADDLGYEAHSAEVGIKRSAQQIYKQGERVTEDFDESLADFTQRTMKALRGDILKKSKSANIAESEALQDASSQPSVSTAPIIGRFKEIVSKLSFADETMMPNTSAGTFKKAIDSFTSKRLMTPDEAQKYTDIALGMNDVDMEGTKLVEVLLPRKVNAEELSNFVKAADDLAKYSTGTTGADAARWSQISNIAREMRKEAFPRLSNLKEFANVELKEQEDLLRSFNLKKTEEMIEGVDSTRNVNNAMKSFVEGKDFDVPDGYSIPKKNFESWLAVNQPDMIDEYLTLKNKSRSATTYRGLGVEYGQVPNVKYSTISDLESALTGKLDNANLVAQSFGDMAPKIRATQQEYARVNDVFKLLGENVGSTIPVNQRIGLRNTLFQAATQGERSADFKKIANALKPEQVQRLNKISQAARGIDRMFSAAGLKNTTWAKNPDAKELSSQLFELIGKYKKFGQSETFNKSLEITPLMKNYMMKFRGSEAYQQLRHEIRSGVNPNGGRNYGRIASYAESLNYNLDAMYRASHAASEQVKSKTKNMLDFSPAAAGVGIGIPTADYKDDVSDFAGETVYTVGNSAANTLVHLIEHVAARYKIGDSQ